MKGENHMNNNKKPSEPLETERWAEILSKVLNQRSDIEANTNKSFSKRCQPDNSLIKVQ